MFSVRCSVFDVSPPSSPMKFLKSLLAQLAGKPVDWDALEEGLIRADLGVPITMRILKILQERDAWSPTGLRDAEKVTRSEIARVLPPETAPITPLPGKPHVILVVGVNGTGKTTS